MNQRKAEFFDGQVAAPWAIDEYGPDEGPKLERLQRVAGLSRGMRVLEPGCGTGRLSELLSAWVGSRGEVVALDISRAMAKACAVRTAGLANVRVLHAGLEDLTEPPGSFQRVICHQVFPHFDDKPLALRLLSGLMADDGQLVIVHFIDSATINDTHRKAGTVVEADLMPGPEELGRMLAKVGLRADFLADDELGYLLRAVRA